MGLLHFFTGVKKLEMLLDLALNGHITPDFFLLLNFLLTLLLAMVKQVGEARDGVEDTVEVEDLEPFQNLGTLEN